MLFQSPPCRWSLASNAPAFRSERSLSSAAVIWIARSRANAFLSRLHVPEFYGPINACGRERPGAGSKSHTHYGHHMSPERGPLVACCQIPKLHGAVENTGGQGVPVGGEGCRLDRGGVPLEDTSYPAHRHVPEPDGGVLTGGGQSLAVG